MSNPLWRERRFTSSCTVCDAPIPKGKRKCAKHLKGLKKPTQGRPVNKGRNARGIAAHKPDRSRTRKAKRQNYEATGNQPSSVRAYRINPAKADRKPKEEVW